MTKVVSIQYPPGGFGHFIHVILSSYGQGFQGKPSIYNFGPGGNSHEFSLVLPTYFDNTFDINKYQKHLKTLTSDFATVLVDLGVDNDSNEYLDFIIPDLTIRICYDDWSWPLLARMLYTRAMAAVTNQKQTIS